MVVCKTIFIKRGLSRTLFTELLWYEKYFSQNTYYGLIVKLQLEFTDIVRISWTFGRVHTGQILMSDSPRRAKLFVLLPMWSRAKFCASSIDTPTMAERYRKITSHEYRAKYWWVTFWHAPSSRWWYIVFVCPRVGVCLSPHAPEQGAFAPEGPPGGWGQGV